MACPGWASGPVWTGRGSDPQLTWPHRGSLSLSSCLTVWIAPSHPAGAPCCILSGRPLGFTGSALSLIGIETHSPPFSCRWGFHRKKLLLCFPRLATVWKSDLHILLYWVSPSWTGSCPSFAEGNRHMPICKVSPSNFTSLVLGPLRFLQMKMALPGNPASSIII